MAYIALSRIAIADILISQVLYMKPWTIILCACSEEYCNLKFVSICISIFSRNLASQLSMGDPIKFKGEKIRREISEWLIP